MTDTATAGVFCAERDGAFDPSKFPFDSRHYRVTFKNGNGTCCDGSLLAYQFPYPADQVAAIEPISDPADAESSAT